ncbi:MAG: hypothetical protein KC613_12840, partial [Myxococcales bacterium]|nr:hypothetical protein [Myxococcales bacterium]
DVSEWGAGGAGFAFTAAQLGHYGEHELRVLEDVLRDGVEVDGPTRLAVARRIHARIGYPGALPADPRGFLTAFYTAQRAHLERGRLLGQITADKRAARERQRT